jgi:hypothetical protein
MQALNPNVLETGLEEGIQAGHLISVFSLYLISRERRSLWLTLSKRNVRIRHAGAQYQVTRSTAASAAKTRKER